MDPKKLEKKIKKQQKTQKFLSMNPHVAFDCAGDKIVAFGPTEAEARDAAIIKGEDFPIILDIREFFPSLIHKA